MKNILSISLFLFFSFSLSAQLPDGSIAPDFTVEDINGDVHSLYDYLDEGKSVILDFGATWCNPCWNYHNTGILESVYEDFGPGGSDQVMVFMVEADGDTSQDCIYGLPTCIGGTTGDWTAGVEYPILNPPAAQADDLASDYSIAFWPTLYGVAPNGEIYEVGQASYDEWASITVNSFQLVNTTYEIDDNGCVGNIDVTTIGGEGELEYEWSSGETTEDLFDLPGGEYTLTITDENNFQAIIGPIDIAGGNGNEVAYSEQDDVTCNGEFSGYLYVEAEGGSGDYSFDWSSGDSGDELFDIPSGDYWLTVTDNNNGCTSETYFFVDEPPALSVNVDILDAGCDVEGEVFIDADGGTGLYTYNFPDFSTTFNEIDLPAGSYEVTVSDFNDCEIVTSFEILATPPPAAVSSASGNITCAAPTITLSSSGSATGSNITYTWFDSSNNIIGTDPSITVSTEGDYILEVFDDETACVGVDEVTVLASVLIPTAITNYSNEITCINTSATVSGMGSTAMGVNYSWTTADGIIMSGHNSIEATVSAGGTYWLQVLDPATGCSNTSSVVVPANDNPPMATIFTGSEFCEGSTIDVCVTTDAFTSITWSIDGITTTDIGTCITVSSTAQVTATVTHLTTGCTNSASTFVTASPAPDASISGELSFCSGSSTNICVDVFSSGNTVAWTNEAGISLGSQQCITIAEPGQYSATVINSSGICQAVETVEITAFDAPSAVLPGDLIICSGEVATICAADVGQNYSWYINGQVIGENQCIDLDVAGDYQLIVDNGSCTDSNMFVVSTEDLDVPALTTSGILDCNNQSVTIESQSNTEVTWINEAGMPLGTGSSYTTNLAGIYTAIATSASGACQTEASIEVTQDDTALPIAGYDFTVAGNTYEFQSSSQGTIATYLWDFGDGATSTDENPTYTYFAAGEYTVCLTVTNDCGSNVSCQTISSSSPLSFNVETFDVSCFGAGDGAMSFQVLGGTAPYEYETSPAVGPVGFEPGEYEVTVTDSNGDSISVTVVINEPAPITISETITNTTQGLEEGEITLDISGGVPGYIYEWDNGETGSTISGLAAGFYTVNITDANGCSSMEVYEVQEITSTNNIDFIKKFIASPNPAYNQLNIELDMDQIKNVDLELINNLGVVVYKSTIEGTATSHLMDVSIYPNGVYFINLRHQAQSMTKKIMIID